MSKSKQCVRFGARLLVGLIALGSGAVIAQQTVSKPRESTEIKREMPERAVLVEARSGLGLSAADIEAIRHDLAGTDFLGLHERLREAMSGAGVLDGSALGRLGPDLVDRLSRRMGSNGSDLLNMPEGLNLDNFKDKFGGGTQLGGRTWFGFDTRGNDTVPDLFVGLDRAQGGLSSWSVLDAGERDTATFDRIVASQGKLMDGEAGFSWSDAGELGVGLGKVVIGAAGVVVGATKGDWRIAGGGALLWMSGVESVGSELAEAVRPSKAENDAEVKGASIATRIALRAKFSGRDGEEKNAEEAERPEEEASTTGEDKEESEGAGSTAEGGKPSPEEPSGSEGTGESEGDEMSFTCAEVGISGEGCEEEDAGTPSNPDVDGGRVLSREEFTERFEGTVNYGSSSGEGAAQPVPGAIAGAPLPAEPRVGDGSGYGLTQPDIEQRAPVTLEEAKPFGDTAPTTQPVPEGESGQGRMPGAEPLGGSGKNF